MPITQSKTKSTRHSKKREIGPVIKGKNQSNKIGNDQDVGMSR